MTNCVDVGEQGGFDVEARLRREFERFKAQLGVDLDLSFVWLPDRNKHLSGEVKNNTVYVYDEEASAALKTLRHELLDHLITTRLIKPLVDVINLLIQSREAQIYQEKERIIRSLSKLIY